MSVTVVERLKQVSVEFIQRHFWKQRADQYDNPPSELMDAAEADTIVFDIHGKRVTVADLLSHPPLAFGIPVVDVDILLSKQQDLIAEIRHNAPDLDDTVGLGQANFDTLYLEVIRRITSYIHCIPASENDHHESVGGLLRHSIEVSSLALRYARSKQLTATNYLDIERVRRPRWVYAAWLVGLMHDAGKLFTDMRVIDVQGRAPQWQPIIGSLLDWAEEHNVSHYKVHFSRGRRHNQHQTQAAYLLDKLLPDAAKNYLIESGDNLHQLIGVALNDYQHFQHFLTDALRVADARSVAADKRIVYDPHLGPKNASLRTNVIRAMRHLIAQWEINDPGTKSRVYMLGNEAYLAYPHAMDDIVSYLGKSGVNCPQSASWMRDFLSDNDITKQEDKEARYSLFMHGNFTKEEVTIVQENPQTDKWVPVVRLTWANYLFDGDVLPANTQGILKLNENFDGVHYVEAEAREILPLEKQRELERKGEAAKQAKIERSKRRQAKKKQKSQQPESPESGRDNHSPSEPLPAEPAANPSQSQMELEAPPAAPKLEKPPAGNFTAVRGKPKKPQQLEATVQPGDDTKPVAIKQPWHRRDAGAIGDMLDQVHTRVSEGQKQLTDYGIYHQGKSSYLIAKTFAAAFNVKATDVTGQLKQAELIQFDMSRPMALLVPFKDSDGHSLKGLHLTGPMTKALDIEQALGQAQEEQQEAPSNLTDTQDSLESEQDIDESPVEQNDTADEPSSPVTTMTSETSEVVDAVQASLKQQLTDLIDKGLLETNNGRYRTSNLPQLMLAIQGAIPFRQAFDALQSLTTMDGDYAYLNQEVFDDQ
ncbi:TraI domain-containing protein [Neiella sp. HB171785]|uniref:TraI domain-containing protein n=1 Tax=Neiella litorisoli TaxID=2771431 RepID=A0A8J6QJ18_9GAMM|nr:MobH family relaxase [Neiella litorisoli]MBD1389487.1 TraI domain-containing protein [Neiella litorisoli]